MEPKTLVSVEGVLFIEDASGQRRMLGNITDVEIVAEDSPEHFSAIQTMIAEEISGEISLGDSAKAFFVDLIKRAKEKEQNKEEHHGDQTEQSRH